MPPLLIRLKKRLGWRLRQAIRQSWHRTLRRFQYRGRERFCPVCRSHLRAFLPCCTPELREDVLCPVCQSHERHRLIWLYFARRAELFERPGLRLLHVAPEEALTAFFTSKPNLEYLSGDLQAPPGLLRFDLTALPFPDDSFDAIYCSHVLEHVPDDGSALAELCRILKPGGWAILQVPIDLSLEETYEDWSIQSPSERERAFGQCDHVRRYGRDYAERLLAAGFLVTVDGFVRELPEDQVRRCGLSPHEEVFFCEKPAD